MKVTDEAVEAALNAKPHHYLEEEGVREIMRAALGGHSNE